MASKALGRRRSSHPGVTEQHGFKLLRITADIHLLEVIVPTRRDDLPLKFALKLDVRHTIDAKEIIRSTTIGFGRVHAIGNDIDTSGFQTFDRFDYFLREIGSLAFRAFGPGGTVVIKLDKDLLHDVTLLAAERGRPAQVDRFRKEAVARIQRTGRALPSRVRNRRKS